MMPRRRRIAGALAIGSVLGLTGVTDASAGTLGGARECYSRFLGVNSNSVGYTVHNVENQSWAWNNATPQNRYSTSGYRRLYWGASAPSLYSASSACRN